MNQQYLKQFCLDKIAEYPDLKSEITDFKTKLQKDEQ